jgi:hypothetical protein
MTRGADTSANVNTSQHVRSVRERLAYLDPEAAPFTLTLDKERSEDADNFKFEWPEKGGDFVGAGFAPKQDAVNGTTGTGTSVVVDNSEYFRVNDIVKVLRTGELMRVTVVTTATDTLTVQRGVGSTGAVALADNDELLIIGSSVAENADVGSPIEHQELWRFNYTQIFRTSLGASRTQQQTKNYLGKPRKRLRMEKAIEHKIDIERAFLFSERNRDVSVITAPVNVTGGFIYWATGNNKDAGGTLTEPEVWNWCEQLFAHTGGSSTRTVYHSLLVGSVFDMLAGARLQTVPSDKTYGIAVKEWLTSHGRLLLVPHRLLEAGALAGEGYGDEAWAADMSKLRYRPLQETQFLPDRQGPGIDGFIDEYLTECGLEFANPLLHGRLTGVTG